MTRRSVLCARILLGGLLLALGAAACGGPQQAVLPTPAELPTVTPTPTPVTPPTLPPTWTPSPSPEPQATATAAPTEASAVDFLIYVADGAIQRVMLDGSPPVALTSAMAARDLALAPDNQRVAFVGAGSGSGSEVYVLDLVTGGLQQSSSLGFADVVDPSWSADGNWLAFAAGQFLGQEREVYTVRPDGLDQSRRTEQATIGLSDPIWTPDSSGLLFAAPGLFLLDLASGQVTPLTIESSFGNDTHPRWRPGSDEIVYIRTEQDTVGYPGGELVAFTLATVSIEQDLPPLVNLYVQDFTFSADGRSMVFTNDFTVNLFDYETRSARRLLETGDILPLAAINADGTRIAYYGPNVSGGAVPQIIVVDATGQAPQVAADVGAAVVTDLIWVHLLPQ
jgi:Tol biopolymer transport system component